MLKILIRLIFLILVLSFFPVFLPQKALASSCTFDYDPHKDALNQYIGDIKITINNTSLDLKPGLYRVQVNDPGGQVYNVKNINFTTGNPVGVTIQHPPNGWAYRTDSQWNLGTYKILFLRNDATIDPKNILCQDNFELKNAPSQSSCTSTIETKPIYPTTDVTLSVQNINKGTYDIYINNQVKFSNNNFDPANPSTLRRNLGKFDGGIYTVVIGKNNRIECAPVCFTVAAMGSNEGGQCETLPDVTKQCANPANCSLAEGKLVKGCNDSTDPNNPDRKNPNPGIPTAIGCIHTNPAELTKDLLKFLIGIGGGLAFLMMLFGAFQMITSGGNPETLAAGRSRLTSAIIGLLFVIFSILLLQIIGVGILNLPGFK